ncbi:Pyridoxamine 5'-phosphate oxidase [Taphrina deformans PYCC 5710]|uniref:pyridoxal 5'-phosphate synthase n=1 Tax=Taphrina deformans (strain PYCC 5710 / ATCC 11124 / CBS 356.35 / IMI 108563 / JCM 9778 / NBRC 8474) TaxID=1097556 RepID=R4XFA9_TAPDE|nr:Pyridoxamine 5'-phosphate oxidase [Taphrina deformans PYCC 5710]|eukprot:CCG83126.1 Pyridoxamine 5'-phosphate oxidase [Taphrina deformans PYCC 5710]
MSGITGASSDKYIFTGGQREQYTKGRLEASDIDASSPFPTFHKARTGHGVPAAEREREAKAAGVTADAVCLSTAALPSGRVSSRMVLLKELDRTGFVIYSNFGTSRKSADLATNQQAYVHRLWFFLDLNDGTTPAQLTFACRSLCFWYEGMERSVRVEGTTERLTDAESQVYFDTRPVGSRIGAWASPQSSVIHDRDELDHRVQEVRATFQVGEDDQTHTKIPVPSFWGGLRIVPQRVEFWSGRNNRLHDRLVMTRQAGGQGDGAKWELERLAP